MTWQDKTTQDNTRHKTGQDKTRPDKMRTEKTRQDKTKQDKTRQDNTTQHKPTQTLTKTSSNNDESRVLYFSCIVRQEPLRKNERKVNILAHHDKSSVVSVLLHYYYHNLCGIILYYSAWYKCIVSNKFCMYNSIRTANNKHHYWKVRHNHNNKTGKNGPGSVTVKRIQTTVGVVMTPWSMPAREHVNLYTGRDDIII